MEKSTESLRRLIEALSDSLGAVIINALKERDVVEIMLNPNGSLFIERIGKGMGREVRWLPVARRTGPGRTLMPYVMIQTQGETA